jgi:hypothetical protein
MSIQHTFTYRAALADSEKVTWKVDDLIGGDKTLDFSKPFLPDALARCSRIECLNATEQLTLNQIRGASYLHLFGLVEEFILPFAVERAREGIHGDKDRVRALLTFADEEAKHQMLFQRFAEEFEAGFPVKAGFIGPAKDIADAVLGHSTLGVALLILHLEWMTQRHYIESVKSDVSIDPQFASLLRHHWQEEAQHAKIDTLIVDELVSSASRAEIDAGIDDFLKIGGLLEGALREQVKLDVATLERAIRRTLTPAQREEIEHVQLKSYRWTFLVSGIEHPSFVKALADISRTGLSRVQEVAHALSA